MRLVATRIVPVHENIAVVLQGLFTRWGTRNSTNLFFSLLGDDTPQNRYLAVWLYLPVNFDSLSSTQRVILCKTLDDELPEVATTAWATLCRGNMETDWLIERIGRCTAAENFYSRLNTLITYRQGDSRVIRYGIKLTADSRSDFRRVAFQCLANVRKPSPEITAVMRKNFSDQDSIIRQKAAFWLGEQGEPSDKQLLLNLWRDPDTKVRIQAFVAIGKMASNSTRNHTPPRINWRDDSVQNELVRYAGNPMVGLDERLSAGRWIASPEKLRASCLELLPLVEKLPSDKNKYTQKEGCFEKNWVREIALSRLVCRWLLVDTYASETSASTFEEDENLNRRRKLLLLLHELMKNRADSNQQLTLLRKELLYWDHQDIVIGLAGRLGAKGIPLADDILTVYSKEPNVDVRWMCLCAVAKMGPEGVAKVTPLLQALSKKSEEGWRAERLLKTIQDDSNR